MLVGSLIFTRFDYAIPVWGPPLQQCQVSHLQHLQNAAVRVTKSLRKYDRISTHRNNLNWLPISHQIRLWSSYVQCFVIIVRKENIFYWTHPFTLVGSSLAWLGRQHLYQACCRKDFASVALCRLASTKGIFVLLRSHHLVEFATFDSLIHAYDCTTNFINFKLQRQWGTLYGQSLIDSLFILFYCSCNCVVLLCRQSVAYLQWGLVGHVPH